MDTTLVPSTPRAAIAGLPGSLRRILSLGGPWRGCLEIRLPDDQVALIGDAGSGPRGVMIIHDLEHSPDIMGRGAMGFAESYAAGYWDTPDLAGLLTLLANNLPALQDVTRGSPIARAWHIVSRLVCRNGRGRSRRNAAAHYDLGNDFYSAWLDRTMTYSAAMFAEAEEDLGLAQERKYRRLAEATGIEPEHHVLEIGCGWGGFAIFLAREIGCRVTAITVSRAQFDAAWDRIKEEGLEDRVSVMLADYRDVSGRFDRIVSIEMFEAVGEEYWPVFFQRLDDLLEPGGRIGLQLITIGNEHFARYRTESDFIRRAIFPGGMLPSDAAMAALERRFGFRRAREIAFGGDYATTLLHWRDRFRSADSVIEELGFDKRFRRRWTYYLAYCEAGFRTGQIDVRQLVYQRLAEHRSGTISRRALPGDALHEREIG